MVEIKEVSDFLEGSYKEIKQKFWDSNNETFPLAMESFNTQVEEKFAGVFDKLGEICKEKNCKVGEVTISLIRQSAWEEHKRAVIEAFDSFEIDKKLIYSDELQVDWLFENWREYKKNLEGDIERQGLSAVIKEPYVIWMMEKSLSDIAILLYTALKPTLMDADEIDNFGKLQYDEGFRISIGEYGDWQNVVFFVPLKMNIEEDNELPLIYQRVEDMNYGGITFVDKDLSCAKFINCGFEKCIFDNVSLKEARFVNCRIKDVIMKNGSMESTGFIKCSLVDLDARTMNAEGAYVSDCVMENVKLDE